MPWPLMFISPLIDAIAAITLPIRSPLIFDDSLFRHGAKLRCCFDATRHDMLFSPPYAPYFFFAFSPDYCHYAIMMARYAPFDAAFR